MACIVMLVLCVVLLVLIMMLLLLLLPEIPRHSFPHGGLVTDGYVFSVGDGLLVLPAVLEHALLPLEHLLSEFVGGVLECCYIGT